MWAKASISPLSKLAWEAGEAQPVGEADRPHIHLYHTPALGCVAYLITGDPFHLENMRTKINRVIGANFNGRQEGLIYSIPDATNYQRTAAFAQMLVLDGMQGRGRAWSFRDVARCYLATAHLFHHGCDHNHISNRY